LSSPGDKLSLDGLQAVADDCARLLHEDFVCFGHDSLAKVCADILRAQEKTLAVAEATTGGLFANAFTDICGASKFFAGGCVCCSNDAKTQLLDVPDCLLQQHGAVSAETAVAMATGAAEKLGADYAVAITGFAGPYGVWSKRLSYPGPRRTVQERAVNAALDWLRRELVRAQAGLVAATPNLGVPQ
jgi:nicotinamide-nucleotide amidase